MYKLLIVDDNPRERGYIREVIEQIQVAVTVVGSSANGKQALELIDQLKPDIVLSDIVMPVMNGIDMAKVIKEKYPAIKVIFMSCHNEFDFAKSAINLDIYDYILKPIVNEDLFNALNRVLNICNRENTQLQERQAMIEQLQKSLPVLQDQFLRDLLYGLHHDSKDICDRIQYLKLEIPTSFNLQVALLSVTHRIPSESSIHDKYLSAYSVEKIIISFSGDTFKVYPLHVSASEYAIILFKNVNGRNVAEGSALDIILKIREEILLKQKVDVKIGISKDSNSMLDISLLYKQCLEAVHTKFYSEQNKVVLYEEIEEVKSNLFEDKVNLHTLFKEVKEMLSCGNESAISVLLDNYFSGNIINNENYVKSFTFSLVNAIQVVLMEQHESLNHVFGEKFSIWDKLNKFETIMDIRQWIYNILKSCMEYLQSSHSSGYDQIVQDIKKIIKNRYAERLTVDGIAELINFSPSHANNIFKEATQKTIFDYLTEYRMEKAKEMLKDPYSKIYLVAGNVGYINQSHFSLLFKKHTGLTPAEYKNKVVL